MLPTSKYVGRMNSGRMSTEEGSDRQGELLGMLRKFYTPARYLAAGLFESLTLSGKAAAGSDNPFSD